MGISQSEAARAAGMTRQRWNDLEGGRRADEDLRIGTLAKIAAVLGVSNPCDLLAKPKKGGKR